MMCRDYECEKHGCRFERERARKDEVDEVAAALLAILRSNEYMLRLALDLGNFEIVEEAKSNIDDVTAKMRTAKLI